MPQCWANPAFPHTKWEPQHPSDDRSFLDLALSDRLCKCLHGFWVVKPPPPTTPTHSDARTNTPGSNLIGPPEGHPRRFRAASFDIAGHMRASDQPFPTMDRHNSLPLACMP